MISSGWCACVYASAILLRGSCFRFAEWPYISAARRGVVTPLAGRYAADQLASTDDIAETYFALYEQSPLGWSNEIDIRPFQEGWSC